MNELALAEDFQFDAQGFLMLRNVFDAERCQRNLEELERLFARQYDDPWLRDGVRGQTTVQLTEGQRRINGLPLWIVCRSLDGARSRVGGPGSPYRVQPGPRRDHSGRIPP